MTIHEQIIKIIPPVRGHDAFGSGEYLASRGDRKHQGIDIACYAGSKVLSVSFGICTKIGYPYNPKDREKGHLRYVQITDENQYLVRYFYVKPTICVGDKVFAFQEIGVTQGLIQIYPGITDHFHFEVKKGKAFFNPYKYLGEL